MTDLDLFTVWLGTCELCFLNVSLSHLPFLNLLLHRLSLFMECCVNRISQTESSTHTCTHSLNVHRITFD